LQCGYHLKINKDYDNIIFNYLLNKSIASRLSTILLSGALLFFCVSSAAQEPEWQLGAGLGVVDFRLYPGSNDNKIYVLPLPYFSYTSKFLEIDRGIRGLLPFGPNWKLDISADFGLPVASEDSVVRAGMPNLDAIIQIGPSLEYSVVGNCFESEHIKLELPLRTAVSVDVDHQLNQGWIVEPRLVYEKHRSGRSGLYAKVKLGLRYATQDYHAYYYDVDSTYVTPQRTLFESDKGYNGLVIDLHTTWRQNDILFWGILRYQNLKHSVIQDSPLVEDHNYYFLGLGITWLLASSH
jgi:MipA family protein